MTAGDDEDVDHFLEASVEDLRREPAPNLPDKSVTRRIDEERVAELADARRYRRRVVVFTLWAVGASVTAATGFMVAYVCSQWGHIESNVMIAYFSSVVVQSIGILYVISRYLFPLSGPHHDGDSDQTA